MIGSIIGDVAGSCYEFCNTKSKNFEFFSERSRFTDDSVLTTATADWLLHGGKCGTYYADWGNTFPSAGYGGRFRDWMWGMEHKGHAEPYNSCGNGSAMRIGPVGWAFDTIGETMEAAKTSAECTHNHPEGIKGAQAVALCIYMARNGATKEDIRNKVTSMFCYDLSFTIDSIRPAYGWNSEFGNGVLCQASVPQAIVAFLDGIDFEDCVRNAISIGGDSDTIACITGSIAEAFYGVPYDLRQKVMTFLPDNIKSVISEFEEKYQGKQDGRGFIVPIKNIFSKSKPRVSKAYNLQRFIDAQEYSYNIALEEIRSGGKRSHWIWYIFPQQKGLGHSCNSEYYGLDGVEEARAYINGPILGTRLREITQALLAHKGQRTIRQLMGSGIDVLKLKTSMKLFDKVSPNDVFSEVIEAFFAKPKCK